MKAIVPNVLTLSNLSCGLLALVLVFKGDFKLATVFFGIALVCDFLDGFAARLLKVHSELGKQLDSLADMLSFGVLPGIVLFKLFNLAHLTGEPFPFWLDYIAFLIPVFSALRLAKFNIDTRQADHFIGLPTPANALFIFSLALLSTQLADAPLKVVLLHPVLLSAISVICSLLLVAELPLIALKFRNFSVKENIGRYALIGISLALFLILRLRALAFIIPLYLLLSLIFKPNKK